MQLPRPAQISTDPGVNASAMQWANLLLTQLEQMLGRSFTTATKPDASSVSVGTIIYVSDGGAGAVFQASNGSAWINLG